MPDSDAITAFITRWENSGAAERANYALFLSELCQLLDLPLPDPTSPDNSQNAYVFERAITRRNPDGSSTTNYIDLYRRHSFLLETKQGYDAPAPVSALNPSPSSLKTGHGKRGTAAFDRALERAYHQGRAYITSLPPEEGRPPFLIICDIGATIDLYAEFSGTGGTYERFPDPVSYRLTLDDLHRPEIRDRLRRIWLDPHSLDPSKIAAQVTRDIAERLAALATSLEADGHHPKTIAGFLQRSLFTMFAEDIGLLPERAFAELLHKVRTNPKGFPTVVRALWQEMAQGTEYSTLLFKEIAYFNGGLFEDTTVLPLNVDQLAMLSDAADTDWSGVEPSIFGTLLTRALDPLERHKLGAEYTPRGYVERLIRPAIIRPLRDQWDAVRIAAATLHDQADQLYAQAAALTDETQSQSTTLSAAQAKKLDAQILKLRSDAKKCDRSALEQVTAFHRHLCQLRVLDPACGTANFLYVTMEHLKRLEAEVLELIAALGGDPGLEMHGFRVRPDQFIGLEINQHAVAIAQLVLWIGYFQWQKKTTGKADTGDRPLLPKHRTIINQDAVLAYDEKIPRLDPETGKMLTIWDGQTTRVHPITGKDVPDEKAQKVLFDYVNPRRAEWPEADYIVGNPPFLGTSRMREALGDGYTEALRKVWKGKVPESADFVMFWWGKAAELVRDGQAKQFGFITTNSISQTFNRRVIEPFLADPKKPIHISYAIPDHPWIDSADAAAVQVAMTVACPGSGAGRLRKVIRETPLPSGQGEKEVTLSSETGTIAANLKIGADLISCKKLKSNMGLNSKGMQLHGQGFLLDPIQAEELFHNNDFARNLIHPYVSCRTLVRGGKNEFAIDAFGLSENELRESSSSIYQHLYLTVKPSRDQNRDKSTHENWWLFGRARDKFRPALKGLNRMLCTPRTAKHRIFLFLDLPVVAESEIVCIALDDAFHLGVLSSTIHSIWALAQGSYLGPTPRYNNSRCFDTFPFPADVASDLIATIRDLGERIDTHRKRQQELHPELTLTDCYNVLEKLRRDEALTTKDKTIHDQGLITLLKQLHDDLDTAALRAYGWTDLISTLPLADRLARATDDSLEQEILTRLVALNHQRAAEESQGHIRYLRPDYQDPRASDAVPSLHQVELPGTEIEADDPSAAPTSKVQKWPMHLSEQVILIRDLLTRTPPDAEALSAHFGRPNKTRLTQIEGILATLRALGHIE